MAKHSRELGPKPPLVRLGPPPARRRGGLAGESPGDEVDSGKSGRVEASDVSESGHVGPVPFEDALTEGVDLDLPAALPPCSIESKVDPSDSTEKATVGRTTTSRDAHPGG
jgi:hypothetical protein